MRWEQEKVKNRIDQQTHDKHRILHGSSKIKNMSTSCCNFIMTATMLGNMKPNLRSMGWEDIK